MKRVLITGARGQLASALLRLAPPGLECQGLDRASLDVGDATDLAAALDGHRPHLVINGAAYNMVDAAEGAGMERALAVNAVAVALLSRACRDRGVPLVHFSTDFVFDGLQRLPYRETDATRPLGVYAASKLAGENLVLAAAEANLVVRVCRLFGPPAPSLGDASTHRPSGNFPLTMLRLASERDTVRVVNDQIGSPTYTLDLATAVWQLIEQHASGLFHLANSGETPFDQYARETFRLAGVNCRVESVPTDAFPTAARRPAYSTLNCDKAYQTGVVPLRDWHAALAEFISSLG